MKTNLRDKATILMAFAAVFLCGYGVGHIIRDRQIASAAQPSPPTTVAWEKETLSLLKDSLELRPEQIGPVESELSKTAREIDRSHHRALLDYHRHLLSLYQRLIALLDQAQADRLREEKRLLDQQIDIMSVQE